jgi:hypothetical protein
MPAILADNDVEGHVERLLLLLESDPWREIWASLSFTVESFETVGLERNVLDSVLWQKCQERQVILITGNRNKQGPDSLEATIQSRNTLQSLPVFTLADRDRILTEKAYAQRAADRLMEYLFDLDQYRGTGRLYLP